MTILFARHVVGARAGIEDDDADIADRNHRFRHGLHRREQPVDVPGALDDDLQLPAAIAAGAEEFLGLLEIVVKGFAVAQVGPDLGRDDFAGRQRRTVMHGDDPDQILVGREHQGRKAPSLGDRELHAVEHVALAFTQRMAVHALVGDDGELGRVDRIGALAQDLALRPLLAAAKQKPSRVLEVRLVLGVVGAEHLRRAKRRAVAREHIGDLALPDGDEIGFVDPVHEKTSHRN